MSSQAVVRHYEVGTRRARSYSSNAKLASTLWVSTLYSEYFAVLRTLVGKTSLLVVARRSTSGEKASSELAGSLYASLSNPASGSHYWDLKALEEDSPETIMALVEMARRTLNYDYMVEAAGRANDLLGSKDGYVEIVPYKLEVAEYRVPEETIERIREHVDKLTSVFAKLGGRAEAELWKLIFSGYREGIVDTIEGITEEEKKYLKDLLNKPFERVALIIAYRQMGNPKKLFIKMLRTVYFRNLVAYQVHCGSVNISDQY